MLIQTHNNIDDSSFSDDAREWLSRWFEKMKSGDPSDIRSPLWDGDDRLDIIRRWQDEVPSTGIPSLDEFENDAISKVGAFSTMLPWSEREDGAKGTYHNRELTVDPIRLRQAYDKVRNRLQPMGRLRPKSLENTIEAAEKSTNWGAPFFRSGTDSFEAHGNLARDLLGSGTFGASDALPAVAGFRGQSAGEALPPKQRLVWMTPHSYILIELMYLRPLLDLLARSPGFAGWGTPDDVDIAVSRVMKSANGDLLLSGDFSSFDESVPTDMIVAAFELTMEFFQTSEERTLDSLLEVFTEIPLLVPDEIWTGEHGIASGLGFTNWIGTIIHLLVMEYVSVSLGVELEDLEILGDDGIYSFDTFPNIEEVESVVRELGMEMNADKQFIGEGLVHYLQRWHSLKYTSNGVSPGVRAAIRTLNSSMSSERFHDWRPEMWSLRSIMQLENAKHHPQFPELVSFYLEGDHFLRENSPAKLLEDVGGPEALKRELGVASFPFRFAPLERYSQFAAVQEIMRQIT